MKRAAGVALAGAALTLVAFLFDAAPLFVVGLAFVALGLLAPAWVLWSARGASVRRRLSADRVVEQEPLEATLEVRFGRLSLGSAEVRDPLVGEPVRL